MDRDCNFLETTPEQRIELYDIVNDCKDFDKDIEVNIFKVGLIKKEMSEDKRIREDTIDKIDDLLKGKALLPNELKKKYRNKKICYCGYERDFNETITTVFHELYHFSDLFDFIKFHQEKDKKGDNISLKGNLKYNLKAELSEFFAEYKVVKKLSNQSRFRDVLMKKVNLLFYFLEEEIKYSEIKNKQFENLSPNVELMDKIFGHKFNKLFRIMGIWRGFKRIDEFFALQESWNNSNPMAQNDDYLIPDLFGYLKEQLLNEKIESLENKLLRKFEDYFITHLNFNFN